MRRSFPSLFRYVALLLVLTVFNTGIAMASYVCPELTAKVMDSQMMDGMPCAGMDIEKPVHCAELSADTKASLEHHSAPPGLAPLSNPALVRILVPLLEMASPTPWSGEIPEPDADPPYLRTLRIRI